MLDSAWLVPLCPLAGAVLNGFFGRRYQRETVGQIAIAAVGLSFLFSLATTITLAARTRNPCIRSPTSPGSPPARTAPRWACCSTASPAP